MSLDRILETVDILLVLEEFLTQVHLLCVVCLDVALPVLLVPLVQFLERELKVTLHHVKELLLRLTTVQVETHRVRVGQCTSSPDNKFSNFL